MRDWHTLPLGELLEIQNGFAFSSKQFGSTGKPLIRIRDLKGGESTEVHYSGSFDPAYLVKAGDLLIGMDGEFRCYQWQGADALLNQRVCRLQKFSEKLVPRFLLYGINKYLKEIEDDTTYTTVKHLSSKQVLSIKFPIPPLAEQKRIVATLDQAFEAIDTAKANAEKSVRNAKELFDSYLGGIFATTDKGWVSGKLASFCREITVGHVGSMAKRYVGSGIPFLRSQNIRSFDVSLANVVYIDEAFHAALSKSKLVPNDVAIVRTGYPGTAAVIPESLQRANCADLVIVRPLPSLNPHFLSAFFNSSYGKALVGGKLVGAAQKHFNVTAAKEATLHVPPLEQQNEIVEQIAVIRAEADRLAGLYHQKSSALNALRQSTMNEAFNGNL